MKIWWACVYHVPICVCLQVDIGEDVEEIEGYGGSFFHITHTDRAAGGLDTSGPAAVLRQVLLSQTTYQ